MKRKELPTGENKGKENTNYRPRSYQEREAEYETAKERIFGPSKKILKARERYDNRKRVRFAIASASIYEGPDS